MKSLIINRLKYKIYTDDNRQYGADVPFKPGLNIVWGPNSVGKSSIVTGLIYGLGLEKCLGIFKLNQNPFKPEFYSRIEGKSITRSYLLLEISNGDETITIFRYLKGDKTNIVAIKECNIENYENTSAFEKYIIEGEGVFSESGFQTFLFNFLEIDIVEVPAYDGKNVKLYFENLASLFFVEQRAGWAQIQARQITRYNIRDVKRVVFEYLMGFDKFDIHLLELEKKELDESIKKQGDRISSKEENIFVLCNGESEEGKLVVDDNDSGKYSIDEYIQLLQRKYKLESLGISNLSENKEKTESNEESLREKLKNTDYRYRKSIDKSKSLLKEIKGYENYIDRIKLNKHKNKQLSKIEEFSLDLKVSICPICEKPLGDNEENECRLCHSDIKRKISTPSQNLDFLEDEEKSFKNVLRSKQLEYRKELEVSQRLKDKLDNTEKILEHQISTFSGKALSSYREKVIKVDSLYKEIDRYERIKSRWKDLDILRAELKVKEAKSNRLKQKIDNYLETSSDIEILKSILDNLKSNVRELGLFKAKEYLINQIKIDSTDNYTPYLDSYDIYNISSSSDNVRIILSYYMALLQTSIQLKDKTKIRFPNILILDEPKQQNLDNKSLISSIDLFENTLNSDGQVILTTYSELKSDRDRLKNYFCHEMKNEQDYLLKLEASPEGQAQ
ncbi:SMC family protein [Carboxylicivirga marina]|uniref:Rad50/SbcC-type AAA domain-containing protein n=1 Tax=Carboxylicivirga marina TaxID=2800988 RepID=A0ABS1HPW3_9BACT|nr:hypothetical protein [Carboxylicivirga marina]MBK3519715.1 hypothetical protein [Carboxylicivirga marina]